MISMTIVATLSIRGGDETANRRPTMKMEQFIRGQLFWGFYPAVSSAGGMTAPGLRLCASVTNCVRLSWVLSHEAAPMV